MARPLANLVLVRYRLFLREPGVIFWVYGFPLLLAVGLGIAFRNRPPQTVDVAVVAGTGERAAAQAVELARDLDADPRIVARAFGRREADERLRVGRSSIAVVLGPPLGLRFDRTRPESLLARALVADALQRRAGRVDAIVVRNDHVTAKGSRYIDFLVPGLIGVNLMSGGMWGVGYNLVDMRVRRLLKRLVATPMRRRDLLLSLVLGRLTFVIFEVAALLAFGHFVFGIELRGSLVAVAAVALAGALSFAGLGLLAASRAEKTETVSGLINLVMMPGFILSGVFFSSGNFPDWAQPFIRALPLTALNDGLRAVITDGASLGAQLVRLLVLAAWGATSFLLAVRLFRWR